MSNVRIFPSVHTQESRRDPRPQSIFWVRRTTIVTVSFEHTETHSGLGCVCNMKVCALGSDHMLGEHILLFNSWSSRLLHVISPSFLVWTPLFPEDEENREQMCRKIVILTNFVRFENQSFPIYVCSKSCNSVITHPCTSPRGLFLMYVVALEIPYPHMFFLWTEDRRTGMN